MATRTTRLDAARAHARQQVATALGEVRVAREVSNVSQLALSRKLGWSQSRYSDFERGAWGTTFEDLSAAAALVGLRPSIVLRRIDEGLRDEGQVRLIGRLREILAPTWRVTVEAPFPVLGDLRAWDMLLRLGDYRLGVETETRLRDQQELVRRIRQRELHGGADHVLIVLTDSTHNRRLVDGLREALGDAYRTTPRVLFGALREGRPLAGSGVVLR